MRTDLNLILVCSECGNALEADSDKTKMNFNSAKNATAEMAIRPCRKCYHEARRPIELIKAALGSVK